MTMPEILNFAALPEIFVLVMASITLLTDVFFSKYCHRINYYLTQATLIAVTALSIYLLKQPSAVEFSGMFSLDPVSTLLKIFIYITSIFAFLYARSFLEERHMGFGEYYSLGLFSILGMMIMVSSENLLPLFLGLEILSLPLYAMIALRLKSGIASEAAMKYFIMGSFASAMLLYGISLLYGVTHTLNIQEAAAIFTQGIASNNTIFACALVFIVAGIAFKLGAAPFHVWAPDVYQGAPSIVTLFLGSAPKIAIVGLSFKLLVQSMPHLQLEWRGLLIIISILSMAIGNIVAVVQTNFKRLLAYSSISHMGYMLLGLIAGDSNGYSASVFYIASYALMTLGGFAMVVLLSRAGIEAESISDLKGLNSRSPWLAFMLLLIMFSMAGVPPTVGFFAKLAVLEALVNVNLIWLAALALIFAIVGSYYYIAVVKVMYFEKPEDTTLLPAVAMDTRLAFSINGLLLLYFGLFPGALIQLCRSVFSL